MKGKGQEQLMKIYPRKEREGEDDIATSQEELQ